MRRRLVYLSVLCCVMTGFAAQVDISGTVTDELGGAVQGAVVRLKTFAGIVDTTDTSGAYALNGVVGVLPSRAAVRQSREWKVKNGAVVLDLAGTARVTVEAYSLSGRLVATPVNAELTPGVHRIPLTQRGAETDVVRVRIGDRVSALKLRAPAGSDVQESGQDPGLALGKALAVSDSLVVTHPYFDRFATEVTSFSGTVNVPSLHYQRLDQGEYIRVLVPNGGEVYTYGQDKLTVAWMQNVSVGSGSGVVDISWSGGMFFCSIPLSELEWNRYPRDKDAAGIKSYKDIDVVGTTRQVLGFWRMSVKDSSAMLCSPVFRGDSMQMAVWDPYPGTIPQNQLRDLGDGFFSVVGKPLD